MTPKKPTVYDASATHSGGIADDRDAELATVLNALAECVRELAISTWLGPGQPESFMTLAEREAREVLAFYRGQFAALDGEAASTSEGGAA